MFYIITSSYSHILYGYSICFLKDINDYEIKTIFIYKAHSSCIKTLIANNSLLLSGSDDESIKIYNLQKKRELGTLLQHNGSVGCIQYIPNSNPKKSCKWVLSSGEDGMIILWRIHDWAALLNIKAHKPSHTIHYSPLIAPHPSGKLCLSIGSTCELKMWDLTNGKCAFRKKLPKTERSTPWLVKGQLNSKGREVPIKLQWNIDGSCYSILYPSHLICFNANTGNIICQLEDEQLLMDMKYISNEFIVITGDAGTISIFSILEGKRIKTMEKAHKLRIKGLSIVPYKSIFPDKPDALPFLVSASSDGELKVWDCNELCNSDITNHDPITQTQTKDRITALTTSYIFSVTGNKRSRNDLKEKEDKKEEDKQEDKDKNIIKEQRKPKRKKPKLKISYE